MVSCELEISSRNHLDSPFKVVTHLTSSADTLTLQIVQDAVANDP